MSEQSDNTLNLLQRWHGGERDALDELLVRDLGYVEAQVRRKLGDGLRREGQTMDFVQDAMVEALQYGPRFLVASRAQFRALLSRIVGNVLVDRHYHANALRRRPRGQVLAARDSILVVDPAVKSVVRPSMAAAEHEEADWVELGLQMLDAEGRWLIRQRQFEDRSFQDLADELGSTPDAVRMKLNRALRRLGRTVERLKSGELEVLLDEVERPPAGGESS